MWNELKNGQLMGYDFDRQRPIGNYIVDFYCKDLLLALEIDGITHQDEIVMYKDGIRQKELEICGVTFIRFDAMLCVNKVEAVVRGIGRWIEEYEKKNGVNENVKRKRAMGGRRRMAVRRRVLGLSFMGPLWKGVAVRC